MAADLADWHVFFQSFHLCFGPYRPDRFFRGVVGTRPGPNRPDFGFDRGGRWPRSGVDRLGALGQWHSDVFVSRQCVCQGGGVQGPGCGLARTVGGGAGAVAKGRVGGGVGYGS